MPAGAAGAAGAAGPAIFLEAEAADDPAIPIPGVPGPAGNTGSTGAQGAAGVPIWVDADDPEQLPPIPGVPGRVGNTGSTGPAGLPIIFEPDFEDHVPFPGPSGPAGATGATGSQGATGNPGAAGNASMTNFLDWEPDDNYLPQQPNPYPNGWNIRGPGSINVANSVNIGGAPIIMNMVGSDLDNEAEENSLFGITLSLLGSQNQWLATNNFYHSLACFNGLGGATLFQAGAQLTSPTVQGYGPTAAALVDMTPDIGTFNGTLTGCTAGVTVPCVWSRHGKICVLSIGTGNNTYTGTSNATTLTMTGLPAAIQPATYTQNTPYTGLTNAGAFTGGNGLALITAGSGTIQFFIGETGAFTATGTKGLSQQTLVYLLN